MSMASPGAPAAGRAAGGYDTIFEAAAAMARLKDDVYRPSRPHSEVYDLLYSEYLRLHDYFGRGENDVMKTLKRLRESILAH